jgi:hypothetical protein
MSPLLSDNLAKLKPQDLSNTAWAFAILGMKHTRFLNAVKYELQERAQLHLSGNRRDVMTRFKGQEIANALWALATLNVPSQGLLANMEPYMIEMAVGGSSSNGSGSSKEPQLTVTNIASSWKRQELANIAWVCAVMGEYPPQLIRLVYMGLLGVGDRPDPNFLRQAHHDGGIQPSAVMSMTYLQMIMDLDMGSKNNPISFPENWDGDSTSYKSSSGSSSGDVLDSLFELRLTTSKVQQAVSQGFDRIGFSHVEEHVIGMDTLAQDHGIQMAANPTEILSLDIANVADKIGIEVDGPGHFISNIDNGSSSMGKVKQINGKLEYQFDWDNENQEINGPSALKLRILHELGWRVINIPFWEWYVMQGDAQKEEEYCRSVLND